MADYENFYPPVFMRGKVRVVNMGRGTSLYSFPDDESTIPFFPKESEMRTLSDQEVNEIGDDIAERTIQMLLEKMDRPTIVMMIERLIQVRDAMDAAGVDTFLELQAKNDQA